MKVLRTQCRDAPGAGGLCQMSCCYPNRQSLQKQEDSERHPTNQTWMSSKHRLRLAHSCLPCFLALVRLFLPVPESLHDGPQALCNTGC